jgi:bacterioferritin-associated ferredoxin
MYVCICNAVSDREIRQCVELGTATLDQIRDALGVTTGCGRCAEAIEQILREGRPVLRSDPFRHGLSVNDRVSPEQRAPTFSEPTLTGAPSDPVRLNCLGRAHEETTMNTDPKGCRALE